MIKNFLHETLLQVCDNELTFLFNFHICLLIGVTMCHTHHLLRRSDASLTS
jgi:hypothetical protein